MKKKIEVKQRDSSDCGAACLASVAACFGLRIPVSRIRLYAGTNKQGTNLNGLIEAAGQLRFRARALRAIGLKAEEIPVPSIYHLVLKNGLQHFVVVYQVNNKWIGYMDPAFGKIVRCPVPDFEKIWSGVVLLLAPSKEFQPGDETKSHFSRIRELIIPHRRQLIRAFLFAVLYTLLGLSVSFY